MPDPRPPVRPSVHLSQLYPPHQNIPQKQQKSERSTKVSVIVAFMRTLSDSV
jgi:hypothetical protein